MRNKDVVLIEDNPNDVELTLHALKQHNVTNHVEVVRDGADALDYLFAQAQYADRNVDDHPILILLDIKLPKVDGLEVLQRMKQDDRTRNIPVVILTSSREDRDVMEAYRLGANSYIVKPVDFGQFVKAVGMVGTYWMGLNEPPPR